ncbi:uncharacterized protein LOC105683230 [Athalia rosae]|uniref:uncharacterized protein LOC105683230 n=1 Tax=Athalia rosae TaxID=37344 RepID=UPI00203398DB|nr:uncharacterized protein LOC105683230 [Athalia rosae]
MSLLARQVVMLLFTALVLIIASATAEQTWTAENQEDPTSQYVGPPEGNFAMLEQARRKIARLSPQARRFLFSPTIHNTIKNSNENKNSNDLGRPDDEDDDNDYRNPPNQSYGSLFPQLIGYLNRRSGTIEPGNLAKGNRLCFTME